MRWLYTLGAGLLLSACGFLGGGAPQPTPDAAQQAAMADPEQVARLMFELEQQGRYEPIGALLTPERYATIVGERGSVAAGYQSANRNLGQLSTFTIQDTRVSGDSAEVDVEVVYPATTFATTVGLIKTDLGWQVQSVRNR